MRDLKNTEFLFVIEINGEAGDGILTSGETLLNSVGMLGHHGSIHKSFPSNVREGRCSVLVKISSQPVSSYFSEPEFIVSFKGQKVTLINKRKNNENYVQLKIPQILRKVSILKGSYLLGIVGKVLGMPSELMLKVLMDNVGNKDKNLTYLNRDVFFDGYNCASKEMQSTTFLLPVVEDLNQKRIIIDGNEAIAMGAVSAGCRFFSSYPITPATTIGDYISTYLPQFDGISHQAEDEISALGAVMGASFNGTRAMTATSGPGLSLMQEFLGYSSMTELPAVIVDVQRSGPSTGMPTKTSQGDLFAAALGGHGEGERIVISPQKVEECFYLTIDAFALAQKYRCPVILLSDSSLAYTRETINYPKTVTNTDNHLSNAEMTSRKSPVTQRVTGIEHDSSNFPTSEEQSRVQQMKRRSSKLIPLTQNCSKLMEWDLEDGINDYQLSVISWGLTAFTTKEAIAKLRSEGYQIAGLFPRLLYPINREAFQHFSEYCNRIVSVEQNQTGQFAKLIMMETGQKILTTCKNSGDPWTTEQVTGVLENYLK
ncbi:hypothetical protein QA601_15575 [Chitinispirillales bacterium ANBcel5]|uniref:hypothetical protein n=1 Tax=Cellulosispirillum alkaliphilum TaxID=3039283 RepID=UPI002A558C84|nr:hypothetical protein [Chitinispirillales bacterium ANBcel5]